VLHAAGCINLAQCCLQAAINQGEVLVHCSVVQLNILGSSAERKSPNRTAWALLPTEVVEGWLNGTGFRGCAQSLSTNPTHKTLNWMRCNRMQQQVRSSRRVRWMGRFIRVLAEGLRTHTVPAL
jgi:hypothetical protein